MFRPLAARSLALILPLAAATATLLSPPGATRAQEDEGEEEVQDPGVQRDVFGRLRSRPSGQGGALMGMWQLVGMNLEGYPERGMHPNGYLLIGRDHLAFQVQVSWDELKVGDEMEDGFQTFMAEYELISGDRMVCRVLIGAYLDEEDDFLDFEPAQLEREFVVQRSGKLLTLRWGEEDWMTFGWREGGRSRGTDIFGRSGAPRGRSGPDIYGRDR